MGGLKEIAILVADDNEFVRRAVCGVLRMDPDFRVICEAASGMEAVDKAKELQPHVVLLDVSMPQLSGFEAARQILAALPQVEIILLTEHAVAEMARAALDAGVRGYVIKSDAATELGDAVRAVMRKERYISSALPVSFDQPADPSLKA